MWLELVHIRYIHWRLVRKIIEVVGGRIEHCALVSRAKVAHPRLEVVVKRLRSKALALEWKITGGHAAIRPEKFKLLHDH
eukprot:SAG31_NODE_41619_length_275_cov_0.590909_1_plen_79_part_10